MKDDCNNLFAKKIKYMWSLNSTQGEKKTNCYSEKYNEISY